MGTTNGVYHWDCRDLGRGGHLAGSAQAEKFDGNAGPEASGIHRSGLAGVVEQSFERGKIYFPSEWFGYRIADKDDCALFLSESGKSMMIFPGRVK